MLQRGKHFITQEFVEALRHRGERFEIGIVKGPHGCLVEHLPVGLVEDQVDAVRARAIRQALASKDHAVAREAGIDGPHSAVTAAIAQRGDDIRTRILVEGPFQLGMLAATLREAEQPHTWVMLPTGMTRGRGRGRASRIWLMTTVSSL